MAYRVSASRVSPTIGDLTNAPEGAWRIQSRFRSTSARIAGRHTLKAGGNIWPVQLNRVILSAYDRGVYSFTNGYTGASTGFPDFLLGNMLSSNRRRVSSARPLTTMYNFYGGDDFRVSRRLTISLVCVMSFARRSSTGMIISRPGFRKMAENSLSPATRPTASAGVPTALFYQTPTRNFAPRIALAYDLFRRRQSHSAHRLRLLLQPGDFQRRVLQCSEPALRVPRQLHRHSHRGQFLSFANPFPTSGALGGQPAGSLSPGI